MFFPSAVQKEETSDKVVADLKKVGGYLQSYSGCGSCSEQTVMNMDQYKQQEKNQTWALNQ